MNKQVITNRKSCEILQFLPGSKMDRIFYSVKSSECNKKYRTIFSFIMNFIHNITKSPYYYLLFYSYSLIISGMCINIHA